MGTQIRSYEADDVPRVLAMNARLAAGGSGWGFYDTHVPRWLPHDPEAAQPVSRRSYLAVDEEGEVRGGYCFKEQRFLVNGEEQVLATWQGPVSEGLVDRKFRQVGLQCLMDMRDRNPLMFCWGGSDRLNELLISLGWSSYGTPLLVKLLQPARVLRQAPFLRTSRARGRLADIAALSGVGTLGIAIAQNAIALRAGRPRPAEFEPVAGFGDWADRIWERAKVGYGCVAVRTAEALDLLMGKPGWPDARIIRIFDGAETIGWAALRVTEMRDDARFGSLTVGSVIDALALPGEEARVAATATRALARDGVDIIAGNYTHPRWLDAFARSGYLAFADRRAMLVSRDLEDVVGPVPGDFAKGLHFTPIDGDGPLGL